MVYPAGKCVLVPQPLKDPLGGVTLLLALSFVLLQDLVDDPGPGPNP